MIKITNKEDCCGCAACEQSCPKHCISLIEDVEGFWYPQLDVTTCIECGLCKKVCPMLNNKEEKLPIRALVAYNESEEIRLASSSGGIFTLCAKKVINAGGVVFGAVFDEHFGVRHDYVETIKELSLFQGSKYVQSRIEDNYYKVKQFLNEKRLVLFSGTPCQIKGLKNYLQKDYSNLFTIDFICHGVPSPTVWQYYLKQTSETLINHFANPTIKSINFRDKSNGWRNYHFTISFKLLNNEIMNLSSPFYKNTYMNLFLNDIILRPSCYACKFKGGRSNSDLTIADCWGIKQLASEMDDDKGISLVMINTNTGNNLMQEIETIKKKEINIIDAVSSNLSWRNVAHYHELRRLFFNKYKKKNLSSYTQYLLKPSILIRIIRKCYRICGIKQIPI